MPTAAAKPQSLAAKLAEIMGLMAHIPKEGFNAAQKYKFVRESDVAEKASALLAERHIFVSQSVTAHSLSELYRTASGNMMWLTTVEMNFAFHDGDSDEVIGPMTFVGYGADTGDKGIYKAMTGAEKYFLMKTFLISTGDDPEADEKVDKTAAAGAAAEGTRVRRSSQPGTQRGGKTDLATEAQVDEVTRLAVAKGLNARALIPLIVGAVGKEPPTGAHPREWLGALSGKDIAAIIAALNAYEPPPDAFTDGAGPGEGGGQDVEENDEMSTQEPLPIV